MLNEDGSGGCLPDAWGATNFNPPSYDPRLRLFFVSARETCASFHPQAPQFVPGQNTAGGVVWADRDQAFGALRAIDVMTGENTAGYARRADRLAVYLTQGELIAVVEIVSPGNKDSTSALKAFVRKAGKLLRRGVHLLVIDLFPPSLRDPHGIHKPIWDQLKEEPFDLPARDPVLYYLQRLRDEAHRFAIAAHRAARQKTLSRSGLDGVEGIGPARKRALLNHFGSARGVRQAGLADLENCPGVGRHMARRIHGHFHPGAGAAGSPPGADRRRA